MTGLFNRLSPQGLRLLALIAVILLLLAFFGSSAVVLRRQHVDMHLHHLYLGWSLALFAELDHWLSAVTLAVGSGIFLQGGNVGVEARW